MRITFFSPSFWCDVGGDLQFYKRETSGDDWLKVGKEAGNWSDQQFSLLSLRQLPRKAFPAELLPPPPEEALLSTLSSIPGAVPRFQLTEKGLLRPVLRPA